MGFLLDAPYAEPFYLGGAVTISAAQKVTPAALGGHGYMLDETNPDWLRHRTVPLLRQQADDSTQPSEHSLNPEGLWRRGGESFHLGAGQTTFDREESSKFRFRNSNGINVWDKWEFSLLPATDAKALSNASNLKLVVVGDRLYVIAGTVISYTANILPNTPTFTTVTGTPGTAPTDIASDGFNVITCHGAAGIWKTTRSTGAVGGAAHITGTVEILGFVKNRFLAANNNALYDISALTVGAGGALPAPLFTQPNTDFQWVGFAEGDAAIYMAGFSGDKSLIYRTAVKQDGTALDAPVIAGRLEDGEIITSISGYLGNFICIGTNKGFRLAVARETGDLSIGARIDTPLSVLCFEGQGEFVWYGLGNHEGDTGLGRFSLKTFTSTELLVPAFAPDIMAQGGSNNIRSVVTFQDIRVFAIDQVGIWAEDTTLEAEGFLDTGEITYGMTEAKIALFYQLAHSAGEGSHETLISVDNGPFLSLGVNTGPFVPNQHGIPRAIGELVGHHFEFRFKLYRDAVEPTLGLTIKSWLFLSEPQASMPTVNIFAALLFSPDLKNMLGLPMEMDTYGELAFIHSLWHDKTPTTWQEGDQSWPVIIDDYDLEYHKVITGISGLKGFNGTCLLKMKVIN